MQASTPESIAVGGEAAPGEEVAELRAAVRSLEAELAETHRRANAAIAAAQERVYWLDRWHVDLNELMLRRWAVAVRAVLRAARGIVRRMRRFTRAIL
jgi:hypothetical protein